MITLSVLLIAAIALLGGALLGKLSDQPDDPSDKLARDIDALLPQIQCAQCGYPGCRPYAQAIAAGSAPIDRCPPGGEQLRISLANMLGEPSKPLASDLEEMPPQVALIDESRCIGCARCIPACPVDAIVGAPQWMHTVLADQCTGCELCLEPCPVDCIDLIAKGEA